MAFDRIALVGEAAFFSRPRTASGVSKGAVNAIALADVLVANSHNVTEALKAWETNQLKFGMYLKWRSLISIIDFNFSRTGNLSCFNL